MSIADNSSTRRIIAVDRALGSRGGVLLSLVLVILAAIAALVLVQGIDRQNADVAHSYEVRNQARELTIALSEAQSSQRSYVLTGDASYFEPYHRATAAVQTRLASLMALTNDSFEQSRSLASMSGTIGAALAELQRTLDLVESGDLQEARRRVQSGSEVQMLNDLRRSLEQFIDQENTVLLDRNKAVNQWGRWLVGAIVLSLAAAVLLAYVLFSRTQQQVSALSQTRSALLSENEVLDKRVRERTQALEEARQHAEHERQRVETLLQDTSHRIGNSLATVSSLLGLQLLRSNSKEVQAALESARARVHAIAAAHRRLRLGQDMETASADDFLDAVLEDLSTTISSSNRISLSGQIDPIVIGARDATTLGILLSELVTNAIKHAFPEGTEGKIEVQLKRVDDVPTLSVWDNGIGLPADHAAGENGLGTVIIRQLSGQFGGVPQFEPRPSGGLLVKIPLPGLDSKKLA
ncbi:sensor histidine kinase [Devosia submarina]|uniref:sensor histidine kinase n=1 Tax=Devosia submarina TaxID=1173082 RepID=UPI000D38577E|nr:CHASE3 domain-containing protein [Devosia submarina]